MGTPYLSEIRLVSFNFPPKGWAFCNGQLLSIDQNQALFALLGTTYGGDGQTNFALPNLQAKSPLHMGSDGFGNTYQIGEVGGESAVTLSLAEMPQHTHTAQGVSTVASKASPAGNAWADSPYNLYSASPSEPMQPASVSSSGGGQPHNNLPPYAVLNYVIALEGIFPSRN